MALTRSFLKGMNLSDEQVSAVIEEHAATVSGLKAEIDKYKGDAEKLGIVQQELDGLKSKNADSWKEKYETLKKTFDDYKAETAAQAKAEKVKAAYTDLLKAANVDSKRLEAILKITDLSGMELDGEGKLVNAEELSKNIKAEWSAFIQNTGTKGSNVETPPTNGNNPTMTRADVYAKDEHGHYKMTTAERQKALAEHPDLLRGGI